jgi:hypothetical protein
MMGKLWDAGASAVTTGGALLTIAGKKLDESGVTAKLNTLVATAAEKTVETGVGLYHSGTEKFSEYQQSNPKLGELTEKSKNALVFAGGAITDVSTVRPYTLL